MKIAIYPGSFDPLTNGHLDILKRATKLFDKVIVLIAINPNKKTTFSLEERIIMLKEVTKDMPNVEIDSTSGLTIDYAIKKGAVALVRGLRAVSDFEYEFQIASTNEFLDDKIEMVFLMARTINTFVSSSMIKELNSQGADIHKLVPSIVLEYLNKSRK